MHVLVTEFMDEAALDDFGSGFETYYRPDLVDDRNALLGALKEMDAIIVRNRTNVDSVLLEAAPKLKAVGRLGVGLDNIDLTACKARGIAVLPATGANAISVAEYVIGATLSLVRGAFSHNHEIIAGRWPRGRLGNGGEVFGRQIGLIGFGMIAQEVAQRATALGMRVMAFDPYLPKNAPAWQGVSNVSIDQIITTSDVISIHVPLTEETRHMISTPEFDLMKPEAVLINTARGDIVDEVALVSALSSQKIAGAALDVFASEPLNAEAGALFKNCPNLILTPHIGGVTAEGNTRVSYLTVANVRAALEGRHDG